MITKNRLGRRLLHKLRLKTPTINFQCFDGIWWGLTLGFTAVIVGFFLSPLMRIATVSCFLDKLPSCPDYISPAFSYLKGQLIYQADLQDVSTKVQAAMPETNQVLVSKHWPNTIVIDITSQYDIANLQIPASSSALLIGNSNYVTGILASPNPNLPTIIASAAAQITQGEKITDKVILAAIDIAVKLPQLETLTLNSPLDIRARGRDGKKYLFTSNKPIDQQLSALQVILSATTINSTDNIYDLRFDHPVLKQAW